MRNLSILAAVATCILQAQSPVVYTGTTELKGGKLVACHLGSVMCRSDLPAATPGLTAHLVDAKGAGMDVPCRVDRFPGEGGQELVVWKVYMPERMFLASLHIGLGKDVLAHLEQPRGLKAPTVEFMGSPGDSQSLSWALTRDKRAGESSFWIRWSTDGGQTWSPKGALYGADALTETHVFDETGGVPKGTLVEMWVPSGLEVHVFRHTLGR